MTPLFVLEKLNAMLDAMEIPDIEIVQRVACKLRSGLLVQGRGKVYPPQYVIAKPQNANHGRSGVENILSPTSPPFPQGPFRCQWLPLITLIRTRTQFYRQHCLQ